MYGVRKVVVDPKIRGLLANTKLPTRTLLVNCLSNIHGQISQRSNGYLYSIPWIIQSTSFY